MLYWYQRSIDYVLQFVDENTPTSFDQDEWNDSTKTMLINCLCLMIIWPLAKRFYRRRSESFANLSEARQWYVIANLSKAACLAVMCLHPSFFESLRNTFYNRALLHENSVVAIKNSENEAIWLKRSSALYLASDLVALFLVPDLPTTTVFHHWTSIILGLCLFSTKLEQANVTLMLALYGAWSSLAFPVNIFLALRFSCKDSWWLPHLALLSLFTYVFVCVINWTWHMAWLVDQIFVSYVLSSWYGMTVLAYMASVVILARDDLILMSWLRDKALKNLDTTRAEIKKD